jgi:hypothetical protein
MNHRHVYHKYVMKDGERTRVFRATCFVENCDHKMSYASFLKRAGYKR